MESMHLYHTHMHIYIYKETQIFLSSPHFLNLAQPSVHVLEAGGTENQNKVLILAAPPHGRCTSLVCSCYVASRNSDTIEEERARARDRVEKYSNSYLHRKDFLNGNKFVMDGSEKNGAAEANADAPLKSNLKKTATASSPTLVEMTMSGHPHHQQGGMMRKVSWSDAHGKDIAHVLEFEPSEEGELGGGVGNSCRCTIQ